MDDVYEPKKLEIASFELFGRRQTDGSIVLGDLHGTCEGTRLQSFPALVRVGGIVYSLESIEKNDDGSNIEWGVYA